MAAHTVARWFQLADQDRDRRLGGAEAVAFFQRSGLPKRSLAEVRHGPGSPDLKPAALDLDRPPCPPSPPPPGPPAQQVRPASPPDLGVL